MRYVSYAEVVRPGERRGCPEAPGTWHRSFLTVAANANGGEREGGVRLSYPLCVPPGLESPPR